MSQNPLLVLFELFVMVLTISLHDATQAWAANRLGDPTARMLGRITMNPVKHFSVWGMVISPLLSIFIFPSLVPYGWGQPVPMTYRNFPKKSGEYLAVLAGPVAQFAAAVVALIVLVILKHTVAAANATLDIVTALALRVPVPVDVAALPGIFPLLLLLYLCIMTNVFLCVFNMLPLPFLDGGRILVHFLPHNAARAFEQYSLYFMIGFFLVGGFLVDIVFGPLLAIFTALLGKL
ncbi:MAG TPA: site-2 protease family protein [Acidobacteriaceae bacterium]